METQWPRERKVRGITKLGNYSIDSFGEKFYGVYEGDDLIAVTVYKHGALEVMWRLFTMERKVKWQGQLYCDICKVNVRKFSSFYDARTKQGVWALMCPDCFIEHGAGRLGIGWGQCYSGKTLEKISG